MALLAYSVRRAIGALLVLLFVILLTHFAVSQAAPSTVPGLRGPVSTLEERIAYFQGLVPLNESWDSFPRDVVLGLAAVGLLFFAWRLAGALRHGPRRPAE
jgi:hypothetical protein